MNPRWTRAIVLIGFCGAFIAFGLIAAVDSYADFSDARHSLEWQTAEGEITYSVRRRSRSKLKTLEYTYRVGQKTYMASRAAFIRVPYSTPVYKTYRKGQKVKVRYDPRNPARAVLEPGAPVLGIIAEFAVSAILILIGAAGLVFGLRK